MSEEFDDAALARFKERLEARANELRTTLDRPSDQTVAVTPDPAIGRLTRVDAMQAGYVSEALRSHMRAELARVERALRRLDEGTFGTCRSCEERISDARLEAKLDATLCVVCASKSER